MSSSTDVPVARIGKPHGIAGEVTVEELTDYPDRLAPGASFATAEGMLSIAARRRHHGILLLKFDGIDTRDAAEALRGRVLTIPLQERRRLGSDEYWPDQLQGLQALLPDGSRLGTVTGVALGSAQDRLIIETAAGRTIEIPFVDELVSDVHPSGGFVVVQPPPGLADEARP